MMRLSNRVYQNCLVTLSAILTGKKVAVATHTPMKYVKMFEGVTNKRILLIKQTEGIYLIKLYTNEN